MIVIGTNFLILKRSRLKLKKSKKKKKNSKKKIVATQLKLTIMVSHTNVIETRNGRRIHWVNLN